MPLEKCVIFAGGDLERPEVVKGRLTGREYVLAADGGARYALALGLTPRKVVGDMDTLGEDELRKLREMGSEILVFPKEKDESDTLLALRDAVESGYADIEIWGALGGRFDHSAANVVLLTHPLAAGARVRLLTWNQRIFLPERGEAIAGAPGDLISFFPMGEDVTGIQTRGLQYQPKDGKLKFNYVMGLSNVMLARECAISWAAGILLCVHTFGGEPGRISGEKGE
ncbi:MAG: thiamine diphosphokinase [Peptococcaceae bacterium]|jgi:thiamine pyrophosphokinase|nr:thiamine diphosphokinase [Peptococcaceae bacterium]